MKVSFLPENLTKFLPIINRVLPNHSQVPILSNVLLSAGKDGFIIQATDLEMGVKLKIPSKIETEGEVTVPGKEFLETISSLPKEKVEIESEKETLTLTCLDNKVSFNTIPSGEFPQLLKEKGEMAAKFTREEFNEIFSDITFSVSVEETRPQLTGVYFNPKEDGIDFITTDGYRMTVKKTTGKKIKAKEGIIISVKIISDVLSMKEEGDILFFVNNSENQAIFEVGDALFVGRIIGGKFPDYEKALPQGSRTKAVFDREELLQSVRLVSVFAKDNSNIVSLSVEEGQIMVESKTQGVGKGEAGVACEQKGDDVRVSLNIKYLMDALKFSKSKTLELKLNSANEPAVFEDKKTNFLHVIMPIQVD